MRQVDVSPEKVEDHWVNSFMHDVLSFCFLFSFVFCFVFFSLVLFFIICCCTTTVCLKCLMRAFSPVLDACHTIVIFCFIVNIKHEYYRKD